MSAASLIAVVIALACAAYAGPATAQTAKPHPQTAKPNSPSGTFVAVLEGGYAVPAVETSAGGTAELTWNGKALHYRLRVDGIDDITGAFVHIGRAGEEAPAVADLFDGFKPGPASGVLAEGTLSSARLHGTTQSRLLHALREDNAYVTVHTRKHPSGEIRGQLRAQPTVAHR